MIQEEILYTSSRTGTTVFYFVPNVTPDLVPILQEPAYVIFNSSNVPISYGTYSGQTQPWLLQNINNYNLNVQLSSVTTNFVTGYSITQTFNTIMDTTQRSLVQQRFTDNITNTIIAQTNINAAQQTYVFFKEHEIDDMFANIKLSRNYETLDTLKTYNKPINTIPVQEARTGILFGKLEAIQLIKNEEGKSIKIPLRNVPIGIFNTNPDFPAPSSLDDNGDRFYMNLSGVTSPNDYFSPSTDPTSTIPIAYAEDQKFLKSNSDLLSLPEKFKYVTITNDNGEFVIYNAPIGNQTVVFEVDLFKQGLSKDEIILNYFPFPPTDNANIGEFPCYYYNQIPVDIVPAWGTNQTGYTEVDIAVSLDLRKWATYIFAPGAYGNEKLETTVAKNSANTLKIQIRDMTNKNFAIKPVEVVQIPEDLDRNTDSQYSWFNEFQSQRKQVEYIKFGCPVLKLPANLYDPNAFKTNVDGVPTTNKGVWLAAYQFRVFVNTQRSIRDTGAFKGSGQFQSHYGLSYAPSNANFGLGNDNSAMSPTPIFPYEKPWSITYPEPYHIPPKPIQKRYDYYTQRTYNNTSNPPAPAGQLLIVEEPAYADGDLVGNEWDPNSTTNENVGGFGFQEKDGVRFPNHIAFVATRNYMYKYERGVAWNEKYANGYEPYWTGTGGTGNGPYVSFPKLPGLSQVVRGEKYQRVECGYGYFMKYFDWNLIFRWPWVTDMYWQNNSTPSSSPSGGIAGFGYLVQGRPVNTYNLDDQNYAFAFDSFENNSVSRGGIEIYRIVNSGFNNILIPQNFVIPTYARLQFGGSANRLQSIQLFNRGVIPVTLKNAFNAGYLPIIVGNNGAGYNGPVNAGSTFTLNPGAWFVIGPGVGTQQTVEYTAWTFPGNNSFNTNTNKYDTASYAMRLVVNGAVDGDYFHGGGVADDGVNQSGPDDATLIWNTAAATIPATSKIVTQPYGDAGGGNGDGTVDGINDTTSNGDPNNTNRIYHVYIV